MAAFRVWMDDPASSPFSGKFHTRKRGSPAAGLVVDKPIPRVGSFAVNERGVDAAVRILVLEQEPDFVIAAFPVGNSLR
jgi:hypothetical protein